MTYKSLMVHVQPTNSSFRRLKTAADLAGRFGAQLIAFTAAQLIESPTPSAILPFPTREGLVAEFKIAFDTLRERVATETGAIRTGWRAAMAPPVDFATENARAADLVIVGRSPEGEPDPGFRLEPVPLLLTVGRPLLLVPPDIEKLSADRIVVAWKAGRHTRLAVQQALPLLVQATSVNVLGVGEETNQEELDDVTAYLKLHGAPAKSEWRGHGSNSVANGIIDWTISSGSDLIVGGGYGRGQFREWVLGGVTRDLLAASPVCCLLSH